MYNCRITVFTPTYNRAYILDQLYQSLRKQTFNGFEWLIVDDGSTDDTESLVRSWMLQDLPFSLRYLKKENGGKHRAINDGLREASGEIFFVVDSDDRLTEDALEKIDRWFVEIQDDPTLQGIAANKGISITDTPNKFFKEHYLDKTLLEMTTYTENGELVLSGERAIAFYTDFHRRYLYPEFPEEKFVTEAVAYNRMANDGYKFRFYNDIIWIYEYKEDGLTMAGSELFLKNPQGYGLWLREKATFEHAGLCERLKLYYTFTCDLSNRIPSKEIAQCIDAPYLFIAAINAAHKLIHKIRE